MLRINKKLFNQESGKITSDTFKNIILPALNSLPEPDLVSLEASPIDPEEAVLCLQREIAYVDLLNPISNIKHIRYIGSKEIHNCVLLYVHTETDHLVAHVDDSKGKLNLFPSISEFTYKNNIEVYLVGGIDKNKTSIHNIKKIIKELYDVAIKLNITIDITKQKVMDRNIYNNGAIYQCLFDFFIDKVDILCRQFFSNTYNKNDLDIFSLNNVKKNEIDIDDEVAHTLNMLLHAQEIYDKKDESINIISKVPSTYRNKFQFLDAVKNVFSKTIFEELSSAGIFKSPTSQLMNFVFDLDSKKIHVINSNLKTINEELRHIQYYNLSSKNYFVCYDGKLARWNNIHLDSATKKISINVCNQVKNNVASKSKISAIAGCSLEYVSDVVNYSKYIIANSKQYNASNTLSKTGFFSLTSAWKKQYQDHSVINEQLLIIRDLTQLPFEAKVRHYPAYTVDAIYEFPSYLEAEKIKNLLHEKNILAHVITLKNDDNHHTFQLCVPAINAGQYATNICSNKAYDVPRPR